MIPYDLFLCPDCEGQCALVEGRLYPSCAGWRRDKLAAMDDAYHVQQDRAARRRMRPADRFAEVVADLVKAIGGRQ